MVKECIDLKRRETQFSECSWEFLTALEMLEVLMDQREDVEEYRGRLENIIAKGYMRHADDGVLLNMAPLWELIPSWSSEPKRVWEELEQGKYDWSGQAMDYWPGRVKEKCRSDKSLATAHGLE